MLTESFDVFISYSHRDAEWVKDWLLPRLEAAGLSVCVDFRDFKIGVPSLINMENAVERSRKTLLVLTPNWVKSEWTKFESLLSQTDDPSGVRQRTLPMMLKKCQLPKRLRIFTYADFTDEKQWEGQLARVITAIGEKKPPALTHINGYKLFYFRTIRNLTFAALSRATGLERGFLRKLEKVKEINGNQEPSLLFAECERNVINLLEHALDAHGRLEADKDDDFLTKYMMFYHENKNLRSSSQSKRDKLELWPQTKAVVFDFDGTLTQPGDNRTTWEKIWVALGYSKEECFELHKRFQRKEFNHERWCEMTLEAFKAANLRREHMAEIASGMPLVDGVAETLDELHKRGLKLFILSGSIKSIIRLVLGEMSEKFEEIKANELVFDSFGNIDKIEGTLFDFEGKAHFIKRIIRDYGLTPSNVLFVGNDYNDIFASRSGARTLCVNARFTNPADDEHWTDAIGEMLNLNEILKFVQP